MINARLVDPGDVTQEVEQPTYLVTFWSQPGLSRGIPSSMLGWSSSEWDVQGGDLDESPPREIYRLRVQQTVDTDGRA